MIIIWLFILNSLCMFLHQLKQNCSLSAVVLMSDIFCPFFTSYEQKGNVVHSVPRYFNFPVFFTQVQKQPIFGEGWRSGYDRKSLLWSPTSFTCETINTASGEQLFCRSSTSHMDKRPRKKSDGKDTPQFDEQSEIDYHRELLSTI